MMNKSDKRFEGQKPLMPQLDKHEGVQQKAPKRGKVFSETDSYLMDLVSRSTDNAILTVRKQQARRSWTLRITGVAAGIAAIFALVFSMMPGQLSHTDEVPNTGVAQVSKPVKPVTESVAMPQQTVEDVKEQALTASRNVVANKPKHHAVTSEKASAEHKSPIDEFLNNISDEDAEELAYYSTPDIPEY